MPYYCTVPRCTSMAGKAKNVSFHQFPRDEELAKLWNKVLKRGKPYTKYSKVCSLHFKPEDYTITNVGKNKGQWRTLRKDAIPSQNLPSDSPIQYQRSPLHWPNSSIAPNVINTQMHQVAQAIYMQTLLAMQAATTTESLNRTSISIGSEPLQIDSQLRGDQNTVSQSSSSPSSLSSLSDETIYNRSSSFKCNVCTKCFKDPDVFFLHKRNHRKSAEGSGSEKENVSINSSLMLQANPILANMLRYSNENVDYNSVNGLVNVFHSFVNGLTSSTVEKEDLVCDSESKLVKDDNI